MSTSGKFTEKLRYSQSRSSSVLCIGLDTDVELLPHTLKPDHASAEQYKWAMIAFNKAIIAATHDICCAYKLNWAFYEPYGAAGMEVIEQTLAAIPTHHVTIADAKRGDIGNTSKRYAATFFEHFGCDAVTVAPYMGRDSVEPFLGYSGKFVFVLALTSNTGSQDFQRLRVVHKGDGVAEQPSHQRLYEYVLRTASTWASPEELGFVVGATHPKELSEIRRSAPHSVLLIPGVGAQGGDAQATIQANAGGAAVVNASRAVLYASQGTDFDQAARQAAQTLNTQLRYVA
jgi:orotidine-5'-phosphate decarboxylase